MRLTTVSRMDVPAGRVYRCEVRTRDADGPTTPLSFDQARHCELGRRPGSWLALAFRLPPGVTRDELGAAWQAVIDRHGTLRTVVTEARPSSPAGRHEADPAAIRPPASELALQPAHVEVTGWTVAADPDHGGATCAGGPAPTRAALRAEFDRSCQPFARPSHRLCLVEPHNPDQRPAVVVGADHSHLDAWSLLVLLRDLLACLDDVRAGRSPGSGLSPATPFAEHTSALAARDPAPMWVRARWAHHMEVGGGQMPTAPLPLGDVSEPRPERVMVRDVLGPGEVDRLCAYARARGVRPIAVALAELARATRDRTGRAFRAVLPVHSRYEPRWHDSVGWFVTNSVVECASTDLGECAAAVDEAIRLGSHPLGPLLRPWGGMPHTPGMLALSWLDHRRLPVEVCDDHPERLDSLEAQHVSATIRTTGVMVWFVVDAGGLHVRCRLPDTPEARASVEPWLDDVCAGLARRAGVAVDVAA